MPGRTTLALLCAAIRASAVSLRARNASEPPRAHRDWDLVIKKAMIIPGWMTEADAAVTIAIAALQRAHGVAGATGEIGVHFGKYFSVLVTTALDSERLFACDVFDDQSMNVDHSGGGATINKFYLNVKHAVDVDVKHDPRVLLVSNSSLTLPERTDTPDNFKLLSIDGGHMEVITFSDLRWAVPRLQPGGVISLDDVFNTEWRGVDRGLRDFFHLVDPQFKQMRPLLMACNKLFLTTTSHHDVYIKHLAQVFGQDKGNNATLFAGAGSIGALLSGLSLSKVGAVRFASINDFNAVMQENDPRPCDPTGRSSPPPGLPMIEASDPQFKLAILSCQDKKFQRAAALFDRSARSL